MAARWYDSGIGRFLSRDTVQPPIQGGVDANLYAYGRANPLVDIDPSCHCPVCEVVAGATAPEWGPIVVTAAGTLALAAFTLVFTGTDSQVQSTATTQASSFSGVRAGDRWWAGASTSSTGTTTSTTDTNGSPTDTSTPGSRAGSGAARSAVARVRTHLPAPALAMNLGSGHLYLPTGLPGATPWLPQDTT